MLSIIGNFLLISSGVLSIASIFFKNRIKLICFCLSSFASIIAFCIVIFAFITSDFSLKNVFLNSSSSLPLIYKISASWASHEGSMLLWVSMLSIIGVLYIYLAKISSESQDFGIIILSFVQILFISFIIFTSNPFDGFSFLPSQGMGLNPMLQDTALAIHPPILYLGNVSYIALFVSGCLLLYKKEDQYQILLLSKGFSSFALMCLTSGIGLGAWWAYRELGWGGFWFFDPVENISLLPWISGIILHHFLLITIKNGKFLRWTITFSLLSFLLSIYGTFIVRSGIISSVHSFAFSPERGFYILAICFTLTVLSILWFVIKNQNLSKISNSLNRYEIGILASNSFWFASLISLIISLIYPIYCSFVNGADIVIDPEYFISIFIPIFIPILLLAAIVPSITKLFNWKNIVCCLLGILITAIISLYIKFGIIAWLIAFGSIYLMLIMSLNFFESEKLLKQYSLFFAHFGFGLLALSILLNSLLSQEIEFIGKIGDKVTNKNLLIKLDNIKFNDGSNYYRQIAIFTVEDNNGNIVNLKPENRLYKIENSLSKEVDIYSFLFYDLYAVLSRIDNKNIYATIYYQPCISFIWLSIFIISLGFFFLLIDKRKI